jgi:hypothetical protein
MTMIVIIISFVGTIQSLITPEIKCMDSRIGLTALVQTGVLIAR